MGCPASLGLAAHRPGVCLAPVDGGRGGPRSRSRFPLASPLLPRACTSGSNKLKAAPDNGGRAGAMGWAAAMTSLGRSQQQRWKAGLFEHVCGKESRLSVVCIFMFHGQQHFPGDLAKLALAESKKGSCSFLSVALPLKAVGLSCLGGGQGWFYLLEKDVQETLIKGPDGQDGAVCWPWAHQPAPRAAGRGRGCGHGC